MTDALAKKLSAGKSIEKKKSPSNAAVKNDTIRKALESDEREGIVTGPPEPGVTKTVESSEVINVDADESDIPSEYDVVHPTGDGKRDKVRALLLGALYKVDEAFVAQEEAQVVANAIENALREKYSGTGTDYRSKFRELNFNIKDPKNGKLRELILNRQIKLDKLLTMSHDELANDDLKKTREEVHERMTRDAQPFNKQEASTDQFKCGRCKQRKCNYFQMQTRSADEPLTTFVTCVNCNNRWKF